MHRAAYAALGLDWTYDALEVLPADLPRFLSELADDWAGLSLTMPLKQDVLPLLDEASDLVAATGAANTVLLRDGRLVGDNTDVHGIVAALALVGLESVSSAVVLGGGATATSAVAALVELGCANPFVFVRSEARAAPLLAAGRRLGSSPVLHEAWSPGAQLVSHGLTVVINTIPGDADLPDLGWPPGTVLLDVTYHPWPTRLAASWRGPVVGGAAMLLHQAARQVELMTGHAAPLDAMRAALPPGLLP